MTTITATVNIPTVIARLKDRARALGYPLDVPRTTRAFEAYWNTRHAIDGTIGGLKSAPDDLARAEARLADTEDRRQIVLGKLAEIEQEIADSPDWRDHPDARERDRRFDRLQLLRDQLRLLREGRLLFAPGQAFERLVDLDARIKELTEQRDRAQCALDGYLQQAEALLGEPVTG